MTMFGTNPGKRSVSEERSGPSGKFRTFPAVRKKLDYGEKLPTFRKEELYAIDLRADLCVLAVSSRF